VPGLVGELALSGKEHPGELEERDPLDARVAVAARRLDEPVLEIAAQLGEVRGLRLAERDRATPRRNERPGICLVKPRARQHVLDDTSEPLVASELHRSGVPRRHRRRDLLDAEARDLLDQVDRACHVARAPRRYGRLAVVDFEPERREPRLLLVPREGQSDEPVGELRLEPYARAFGQARVHVDVPDPARTAQLDEELRRVHRRLLGGVRVDALLPPRRRLRAQAKAP
jgi:hypothetical protein